MKVEKRKREDDGGANRKKGKACQDDDGVKVVMPDDEEVEEFFAILKRVHAAVKYFRERNAGGRSTNRNFTATPWNPSFERDDFEEVKKEIEISEDNRNAGLDLKL